MIFGRSTVIIMAAIVATMQFVKQTLFLMFPDVDQGTISTMVDLLSGALGAWIAVLASKSTTPVSDPRLPFGTVVQATDPSTGVIVGHVQVPEPAPADVVPDVGENDGKPD